MNETDPTAGGRGRRAHVAGGVRRSRGRHRRRWSTLVMAVGVPAVVGPYLLFVQADSDAATVDSDAWYTLVSVRSDKALGVPGADTSDGVRIRQEGRVAGATSQQWRLRATADGYYELENRGTHKVVGVRGPLSGRPPPSSSRPTAVPPRSSGGCGTWATERWRSSRAAVAWCWMCGAVGATRVYLSSSTPTRAAPTSAGGW